MYCQTIVAGISDEYGIYYTINAKRIEHTSSPVAWLIRVTPAPSCGRLLFLAKPIIHQRVAEPHGGLGLGQHHFERWTP